MCPHCTLNPLEEVQESASHDEAAHHLMMHENGGHNVPFSAHLGVFRRRVAAAEKPEAINHTTEWEPSEDEMVKAILNTPLWALGLSLRARNGLVKTLGATCLGDLPKFTEEEPHSSHLIGRATIGEVKRCLESWGLSLKAKEA